jgi:hypothetical protein
MPARGEEIAAVRQEIMDLLCEQMEALDSPSGLTDERLCDCYRRQERVQELRERLQVLAGSKAGTDEANPEVSGSPETTSCGARALVSTETAVRI